ncbi:glycosyltransferase, family 2 [Campylobacter blaseri]|uniref:Glycosyl transferase n=1 Tax=Campylobacter blaseri TaxID=2042961 RepID=A0A2P8R286_9BACT|nr:glycosyltransferase family 2 protein [Campylobacter blaseri]PSM52614.1 glycosyl transferase [Campylobacter blaseri]PSM54262.1 glycosyl transferase [Campylobacter blaseri]QKF85913.1 glycosyltransferase, family 2 [Campylobacter blaseri]
MNDLVSIITPSYKSKKFIEETINSVLSQTYINWEMIIVDDCSPDDSNHVIEFYVKKDNRINLIKLDKNSGPAIARNKGIEVAKGRYIAFLDSDDLWLPQKLERQINFMKENGLAFTYSSYYIISEDGKNIGEFKTKEYINYNTMLKTCSVGCLTAIYDIEKIGKIFMPLIPKGQDYATWLKIFKKIKYSKGILEPLAMYRIVENSVSSNKIRAAKQQWKIYRKVENLNIFKSLYYFIFYAYNGVKKYK